MFLTLVFENLSCRKDTSFSSISVKISFMSMSNYSLKGHILYLRAVIKTDVWGPSASLPIDRQLCTHWYPSYCHPSIHQPGKLKCSIVFLLFHFIKGFADHSRKYVYFSAKNHKAPDPRYYWSTNPPGQRQAERLCSAWPTIRGDTSLLLISFDT